MRPLPRTRGNRLVVCAALVCLAAAQSSRVHPVSGREYAYPMGVAGAAWLERAEREDEEAPARALQIIGIEPGSTIADIGAGSGYFTLRMARMVGPGGRVYANDIQQGMLDIIRKRLSEEGITNVTLVLGETADPKLPPSSIDMALMVDVYHEVQEPQKMLRRIREALKPAGRLVLLEYRKEDPSIPINPTHKMSVKEVRLEREHEGFTLASVSEKLPRQHIFVFRK